MNAEVEDMNMEQECEHVNVYINVLNVVSLGFIIRCHKSGGQSSVWSSLVIRHQSSVEDNTRTTKGLTDIIH